MSSPWARRGAAMVLAVGSVTCVVVAIRNQPDPAPDDRAELATPLWSARRTPHAVADALGGLRLQSELTAATAGVDACFVVEDEAGVVAAGNAAAPLVGASTQKLLVGAAALAALGPDATFETNVAAPGPPVNGRVDRLWLVGGGDPVLTTPERAADLTADPLTAGGPTTALSTLADAVVAAGVRQVPGGIVGDDSRHDPTRYLPVWPDRFRTQGQIGPLGALTVDDGLATGGPAVTDPAVHAASELTRLLRDRGVEVGEPARGETAPDAVTVATVPSPPLAQVVGGLLASSDNLTAELLVRELAVRAGRAATTDDGLEVVRAELGELGLPLDGVTLVDGSGLSPDNRVTCTALVAALDLGDRPGLEPLRDGLAVAGERGTLARRFVGTPLAGHLRAKTGTLAGASALAGRLDVTRPVEFAWVLNGELGESSGIALREDLAEITARYPDVPPSDALVPAPAPPG